MIMAGSNISGIETVSSITVDDVGNYLRGAEYSEDDEKLMATALNVAKSFIKSYTGLDDEGMDAHADLVTVVFVLCSDMYDNRAYYVDKSNINKVVESILNLHVRNLLPKDDES